MSATPYLVMVPDADSMPSRTIVNGVEGAVVVAGSTADAIAMCKSLSSEDVSKMWDASTVTTIAPDTSLHGWTLDIVINNPNGTLFGEVTYLANGAGGVAATGVLTSSDPYVAGSDSITIGTRVYHFVTTPAVDGDVKATGVEANDILNLTHAINDAGGVAGTDYFVTAADPNVTAVAAAHTCTVTAKVSGLGGNSVATTNVESDADASWGSATLTGGVSADTFDSIGPAMGAAINAAGLGISHAAYNASTNVLTVAGTADNLGDHDLEVNFYPADFVSKQAIPGAVGAIVDGGSAGAALTVAFAADNYVIPLNTAGVRAVNLLESGGSGAGAYVVSPGGADGSSEGVTYWDGVDTAVVYAASAADASADAIAEYANTMLELWELATPIRAVAGSDMKGWTLRVTLTAPAAPAYDNSHTYIAGNQVLWTDGQTYQSISGSTGVPPPTKTAWFLVKGVGLPAVDQTYVGVTSDTVDAMGTAMATKLNADPSGLVSHAAYSTPTLTAAGTADNLGAYSLGITLLPPGALNTQGSVPGFIGAIDDKGATGDDVSVALVPANTIPAVVAEVARS